MSGVLLVGFGRTNQAVCAQLVERGCSAVAVDDTPDVQARERAVSLGVELLEGPSPEDWSDLVKDAQALVPTPGLPEAHLAMGAAAAFDVPVISEFDLAQKWDSRPVLAVTGTNGKTTVTLLVEAMMRASGVSVTVAGNTDVPLVEAIRDDIPTVFVAEASSFRLGHSRWFRPAVGTWLNFAPDHLDVHQSLDTYRRAKTKLWAQSDDHTIAVVNRDDPVVAASTPQRGQVVDYGLTEGHCRLAGDALWAGSEKLMDVAELRRRYPHELSNQLAAAATALAGGAHLDGVRAAMRDWAGLPHRMALVAERNGVAFYNDSKATTPHAVRAALGSLDRCLLIAGGRNKGLDLSSLADEVERIKAVVAIGEAASEVERVFAGRCPVVRASSMSEAVAAAADRAVSGDTVLLSPGCASFDWYRSYGERGNDFARLVHELIGDIR